MMRVALPLLAPGFRPLELPRIPLKLQATLPAFTTAEPQDTPVPTDEAYSGTGCDVASAERALIDSRHTLYLPDLPGLALGLA
jgi:hypothetical protein